MIRVLVVDDHPLFRAGLEGLLTTVPDVDVVGSAVDGEQAVRLALELRPDAVLVLSMVRDETTVAAALRVGARGYLLKESGQDEVLAALRTVAAGGQVLGPRVGEGAAPQEPLTEREAEVASLMARGSTNAEIARELGVSLKTVQNHVSHVLLKLGVRDRTQATLRLRGVD